MSVCVEHIKKVEKCIDKINVWIYCENLSLMLTDMLQGQSTKL